MNKEESSINEERELQAALADQSIQYQLFQYAYEQKNKQSNEFARLEVQIAAILFAVISSMFAFDKLDDSTTTYPLLASLLFLLVSMLFGLMNTHLKSKFWFRQTGLQRKIIKEASMAVIGKQTLDKSLDNQAKIAEGKIHTSSPNWPWELQTVFLLLGLASTLASIFSTVFL